MKMRKACNGIRLWHSLKEQREKEKAQAKDQRGNNVGIEGNLDISPRAARDLLREQKEGPKAATRARAKARAGRAGKLDTWHMSAMKKSGEGQC